MLQIVANNYTLGISDTYIYKYTISIDILLFLNIFSLLTNINNNYTSLYSGIRKLLFTIIMNVLFLK